MKFLISVFSSVLLGFLILLIQIYRYLLSPLLGAGKCRYEPTCSSYALEAIRKHRFCGCVLAVKRIISCQPWGGCGFDPVPEQCHCDVLRIKKSLKRESSQFGG